MEMEETTTRTLKYNYQIELDLISIKRGNQWNT